MVLCNKSEKEEEVPGNKSTNYWMKSIIFIEQNKTMHKKIWNKKMKIGKIKLK